MSAAVLLLFTLICLDYTFYVETKCSDSTSPLPAETIFRGGGLRETFSLTLLSLSARVSAILRTEFQKYIE